MSKDVKIINYSPGKGIRVRLRGKRLSKGVISLFLDYYTGYTKNEAGKIKTRRQIEYLKRYLKEKPATPEEKNKNKEVFLLAQAIRNQRESDLMYKEEGLVAPYRKKSNFFDYCEAYISKYQKKDLRMVKMAVKEFRSYTGETHLTPIQIDKNRITGFRDYLLNKFNGETPNSVFARFKKIIAAATDDGLFSKNPAEKIKCKVPTGIPKEILTPDEIIKLAAAECGNPEVKRAFLLCLNTGLRFVDIKDLKYKHITNKLIKKQQQKTGREVTIDLNPVAVGLIGTLKEPEENVFNLPTYESCRRTLKNWTKKAGINKNVTWHSARHSFATILLMDKTDIKTVGNLLGHSKLQHTQKYTHIVDALKEQAVNTLPKIELD